jgi:hypothetical protein
VPQAFYNDRWENDMKLKQVAAGAVLALVGGIAAGGTYTPVPITIDFDNRVASGDMYSARLSANPDALIGCGIRSPAPGVTFAFCQARLGPDDDQLAQCFTEDPAQLATIGAMDDFSYIVFRWDIDGNCLSVGNSTQSLYLPEFFKTDKKK